MNTSTTDTKYVPKKFIFLYRFTTLTWNQPPCCFDIPRGLLGVRWPPRIKQYSKSDFFLLFVLFQSYKSNLTRGFWKVWLPLWLFVSLTVSKIIRRVERIFRKISRNVNNRPRNIWLHLLMFQIPEGLRPLIFPSQVANCLKKIF